MKSEQQLLGDYLTRPVFNGDWAHRMTEWGEPTDVHYNLVHYSTESTKSAGGKLAAAFQ